jgi:hypothetical protein
MIYNYGALTARDGFGPFAARVIQSGGNFTGKWSAEWYVSLTICEDRVSAEDLVEQIGTTVK